MAPKSKAPASPFSTGRVSMSRGAGIFISIKPDSEMTFAAATSLDEMRSGQIHQHWDVNPAVYHPCIRSTGYCPACAIGHQSTFKAYLPVLTQDGQVKVYAFGIKVVEQLQDLERDLGDLKGTVLRLRRKGSSLNTRYQIREVPGEEKVDVEGLEIPDYIPMLGPSTAEEIEAALRASGIEVPERAGSAGSAKSEGKIISTTPSWGSGDDEEEPF